MSNRFQAGTSPPVSNLGLMDGYPGRHPARRALSWHTEHCFAHEEAPHVVTTVKRLGHVAGGLIALAGLLVLVAAPTALAAEVQQGQTITVGPDQVVDDDLYAFGSNVQVLGKVNGDVFAVGNTVTIGGTVRGVSIPPVTRCPLTAMYSIACMPLAVR